MCKLCDDEDKYGHEPAAKCLENIGCLNHDCKSRKDCGRFMHGDCDGEFEPRLHSDRCDWYKEKK